jgi:assimilatory nitrate reductase catalytic subunit
VRADLLLPAAGWGEKTGTFINSERRIGVIKRVCKAPGEARTDFEIFQGIAEAWGVGPMFRAWRNPEAAFQIMKQLSRGRPCDFSGIESHAQIDEMGGIQWPLPDGTAPAPREERRLFEDGKFFRENGRAKFIYATPVALPEPTNEKFPLLLLTGRGSSSQWHTETRTKKSAVLRKLAPNVLHVEISPVDAKAAGIQPGDWVRVRSARGAVEAKAFVTHVVQPGQVFLPMHHSAVNQLTFAAFDPYSRQPAYKASAVCVEKLALGDAQARDAMRRAMT